MLKTTELIKTRNYELAIYKKGSADSNRLVLVLPGLLDTKDMAHMHSHVDFLSSKGFLALSFDPMGTWESKGSIELYTMSRYLDQIKEIIQYYGEKPTLLVGHSRGGSMALLGGTRIAQVKAFVAIMTRASFSSRKPDLEWKKKGYRNHLRDAPKSYKEKQVSFELPYEFEADALQYDMLKDLKSCIKPKLFIAGSRDTKVNADLVKDYFEVSAPPKQFEIIESDHNYRKKENLIQKVNNIIEGFLQANSVFLP